MKEDLENQLMSKEAELLEQLQQQKDALIIEKKKVEEDLQKSMEKALEEKNKELEDQLHKEKERLEKVWGLQSESHHIHVFKTNKQSNYQKNHQWALCLMTKTIKFSFLKMLS